MKIALLLVSALGIFAGCRYEHSGETAASVSNEWASLTALKVEDRLGGVGE